ncbi:MAG: DUF4389 domain-containing protein [Candidatus Hadarchaeales archaeon]
MGERAEALIRIPLAFVYGIIAWAWGLLTGLAVIVHWFHALILGRRHRGIAEFTNRFIAYVYEVYRYLYMVTNERPWPVGKSRKPPPHPVKME